MSGFSTAPSPQPGTGSSAPWDFATFLQKTADERTIAEGPGGATVVLYKDTLFSPPPSQEGIGGPHQKLSVKTNDPKLDEPSLAGIGLWSMQFANTILQIVVGAMPSETRLDTLEGGETTSDALAYRQEALYQALVEAGLITPETTGGTTVTPIGGVTTGEEPEGISERAGGVYDANAAFLSWYAALSSELSASLPPLSSETKELLEKIGSSDPAAIKEALLNLANLESLTLTPAQEALLASKIDILTEEIKNANLDGGTVALNMTLPWLMLPVFMEGLDVSTDTTLSAADREVLTGMLTNICTSLAKANFLLAVSTKSPSQEYLNLMSGDPKLVGGLLFTIAGPMALPEGVADSDLVAAISSLTTALCSLTPEEMEIFKSVDKNALGALLTKILDKAVASGIISQEVKAALVPTLVPLLASSISDINRVKLTGDLSSKNPKEIENSLVFLTGTNTDPRLTPTAHRVVMSYIQALISVLVIMSNIRALMLQMETTFTQELGVAKTSAIMTELKTAQILYLTSLEKTLATYEVNIHEIKHAKFMKILMPVLAIVVAVIMIIITVLLAIVTCGSAAAAGAGLTVGCVSAILGAASAVVIGTLTIVDAVCQWSKSEGLWQMLAKAMGYTDSMAVAIITMIMQIIIQAIVIGLTLGLMAPFVAASSFVQGLLAVSKAGLSTIITIALTCVFSSGVVTLALQKLAELLFKDNAKKTGIFSAILSAILMLSTMFITMILSRKFAPKVTEVVGGAAKQGGAPVEELTAAAAKQATVATKEAEAAGKAAVAASAKAAEEAKVAETAVSSEAVETTVNQIKETGLKAVQRYIKSLAVYKYLKPTGKAIKQELAEWKDYFLKDLNKVAKQARVTKDFAKLQEEFEQAQKKLTNATDELSDVAEQVQAIPDQPIAGATANNACNNALKTIASRIWQHIVDSIKGYRVETSMKGSIAVMNRICQVVMVGTDILRWILLALQITAGLASYRAAKTEALYREMLAVYAEDTSSLQAVMALFNNLAGIDQVETIEKINAASQEATDNWLKVLQLVTTFIQDAGKRINEMASKAGR